ncbi:F-box/kelch-repeat protein At3g23880-like [Beta vulgaris subsp. vulgaris]|uniref:F-box/kelch-repeat protein At3g23880-like n=1 Tax=Beta vulgaris subsp. vulgaris TaxID=3555 RepID=UPI00053F6B31|nr:F-box/kelch-repeat protein At3g23880-like [Beta vulgaris subsp. vulgaris]
MMKLQDFPEDIQVNILKRLPPPSLLCLMSTCKSMFSLVTSPTLMVSSSTTRNTGYYLYSSCTHDGKQTFFLVNKSKKITKINSSNVTVDSNHYLIGSSHGVVCFANIFHHQDLNLVLWNPSINKSLSIPTPLIASSIQRSHTLGFGFDYSCTDFKVVRIVINPTEDVRIYADVYAVHSGTWKKVTGLLSRPISKIIEQGVFIDGVIHWMLKISATDYTILTYNLAHEIFHEIDIPGDIVGENMGLVLSKVERSGKEKLAIYHNDYICKIWVMMEYGVQSSWELLCEIDCGEEYGKVLNVQNDKEIMVSTSSGRLFFFNPENNQIYDVVRQDEVMDYVGPYIKTLVLPTV